MDWSVNIWSVLLAGIMSTVLGVTWFSNLMFGKIWMKLEGLKKPTKKQMKEGMKSMFFGLLMSFIPAYTIGVLANNIVIFGWLEGLVLGLLVGIGIAAIKGMDNVLWGKETLQLYWIKTSYTIINYALIGVIVSLLN